MDTIVVGAGIIGASIAWRLAQAGVSVTLIDAGRIGGEASWAGAGMLAPGGESARTPAWTRMALESLRRWPDYVSELEGESGLSIDYRQCGGLDLAADPGEWNGLRERAAWLAGLGVAVHVTERAELAALAPGLPPSFIGALHHPADAVANPRDVMNALRVALESRGVQLREFTPVAAIDLDGAGVSASVLSGAEPVRASAAVLAAGAWSSRIAVTRRGQPVPLPEAFPIKGHLAGYTLEPGTLGPVRRHGHTYVLQRKSGFTIVGSNEERSGFDRAVRPEMITALAAAGRGLFAPLEQAVPSETWIGFRPATDTLEPEVRRLGADPLWLAYGHYRTGILMAPLTAEVISREIR